MDFGYYVVLSLSNKKSVQRLENLDRIKINDSSSYLPRCEFHFKSKVNYSLEFCERQIMEDKILKEFRAYTGTRISPSIDKLIQKPDFEIMLFSRKYICGINPHPPVVYKEATYTGNNISGYYYEEMRRVNEPGCCGIVATAVVTNQDIHHVNEALIRNGKKRGVSGTPTEVTIKTLQDFGCGIQEYSIIKYGGLGTSVSTYDISILEKILPKNKRFLFVVDMPHHANNIELCAHILAFVNGKTEDYTKNANHRISRILEVTILPPIQKLPNLQTQPVQGKEHDNTLFTYQELIQRIGSINPQNTQLIHTLCRTIDVLNK